jgi:hypothetical protein
LNAVAPQLESAWFQPLKLKCGFLVSIFAFNLCRYNAVSRALAASPKVNATWDAARGVAVHHPTVDVAIAVATDGGRAYNRSFHCLI